MSDENTGPIRARRGFAAAGALFCAAAIGFGAYGAHAAEAVARQRIEIACLYLLVHGLVLVMLAPRKQHVLGWCALSGWAAGTLLFSGSLLSSALAGTATVLAPSGGVILILAWVLQAIVALRR